MVSSSPGEGGWYSRLDPEPIEVIKAWDLSYLEGNALKYLARWRHKNGVEDLQKAQWYIQRLIDEATESS